MARKYRDIKIRRNRGQVAIGDNNTQAQVGPGNEDAPSVWERPWIIIGAVAAAVSALAAVVTLLVSYY